MSQVVKNSHSTTTTCLSSSLIQLLKEYIHIPENNKWKVFQYKDALVNLEKTNVPYKTETRILVEEGDGFIQDLLVLAVAS